MLKKPIKSETYKKNEDGSFAAEYDPAFKNQPFDINFGKESVGMSTGKVKDIDFNINIVDAPAGEEGLLKVVSNAGPAESLIMVIRVLIKLVFAVAEMYDLDVEGVMNNARAFTDTEFYSKLLNDNERRN